jgi:UDP-N-acetylmuramoyl-L-alanyl-D-glutamate--2,6-diaminopimelate ligase
MNAMLPIHSLTLVGGLRALKKPGVKLTADTRELNDGDIFLAYPAGNQRQLTDNRTHISKALANGAAGVLYEPSNLDSHLQEVCKDERCIAVPNLGELAGEICAEWYDHPSRQMQVIGVTGTNGKTTVAQWLAQALDGSDGRCATIGTLGAGFLEGLKPNGFTTPDACRLQEILFSLLKDHAHSVAIEVSSHALDQGRVNGIEFDTVIFTNLTQDHLDYHGDIQEYGKAKSKIFGLPGIKHIVLNIDDAFGQASFDDLRDQLSPNQDIWLYGLDAPSNLFNSTDLGPHIRSLRATQLNMGVAGNSFSVELDGQKLGDIATQLIGSFNISNALAVLATFLASGMSFEQAKSKIELLKPVIGRLEILRPRSTQMPIAVVDFAHTPDALEKVLKVLRPLAQSRGGKLWCLFGCGGDRDPIKRSVMGGIAEALADYVTVTSDNPRSEDPQFIVNQILQGMRYAEKALVNLDRASAILQTIRAAKPEDVVLVAGKGHEQTQEIAGKRLPFSDQLHVEIAMGGLL